MKLSHFFALLSLACMLADGGVAFAKDWTHPSGYSFTLPDDWSVTTDGDIMLVSPPSAELTMVFAAPLEGDALEAATRAPVLLPELRPLEMPEEQSVRVAELRPLEPPLEPTLHPVEDQYAKLVKWQSWESNLVQLEMVLVESGAKVVPVWLMHKGELAAEQRAAFEQIKESLTFEK